MARPYIDGPVMIIFVDTVFDADLSVVNEVDADGIVWAKEVEDYQRFGVVVTDERGYMRQIVEKPATPISRLANIGLYYIRDWRSLFEGIDRTLAGPRTKGEWFLTDAFQYMIDKGRHLFTAEVEGWYDCGKVETLLDTNRHLLSVGAARRPPAVPGVEIIEPVYVAEGVVLKDCVVGPNVSIDVRTVLDGTKASNAIIGSDSRIERCCVSRSLIGDGVALADKELEGVVAAADEIAEAP